VARPLSIALTSLLDALDEVTVVGDPDDVTVSSVVEDDRRVEPGALFCCVVGSAVDGHDRAAEAVGLGAVALLVERPLPLDVPQAVVPSSRAALGPVAARAHGDPSRSLEVVGVTGTNGKTTTVAMVRAVLEAAGRPTTTIGTLSAGAPAGGASGPPTTPGAADLQELLADARDDGRTAVAMEVSSHAMVQHRVAGVHFDVAVFTNLSRDHLDLHATLEDYFAAKAALFEPELTDRAVVNADDPHGRLLLDAARVPTRAFSLDDVEDLEVGVMGSTCTWHGHRLHIPLGGAFNVSNALAAATAALELGIDVGTVVDGIAAVPPVDGRFEVVEPGPPVTVVVDYAHTPDGLEQLLRAARAACEGRVLLVFGCGGDRDREKRPEMGEIAARWADVAVVTSDNPRSEDPLDIIEAVRAGAPPGSLDAEPDRRTAIGRALDLAAEGDLVVVAGKGHETTQTFAQGVIDFDDREVVREEVARRAGDLGGEGR
jgi:UDP-N-acetylmuramoyl-L-alanyl-D-glutamate--2,6-diaminopimelate ligase